MPYLLKSSVRQDCGQAVKVWLPLRGGKKRDSVDKATGAHYLVVYAGPRRTIDGCQRRVWSRQMGLHPTFHTKDDWAGITRPWKWHVGVVILDYLSASLSFAVLLRVARSTSDNITNSGSASNRCESVFDLYCQDTECVQRELGFLSAHPLLTSFLFFFDRMCDAGGQVGPRRFRLRKRKCFSMSCRPTSWPTPDYCSYLDLSASVIISTAVKYANHICSGYLATARIRRATIAKDHAWFEALWYYSLYQNLSCSLWWKF